jgi:hypothetical protein
MSVNVLLEKSYLIHQPPILSKLQKITFNKVTTEELTNIFSSPSIRIPTLKEFFHFLRYGKGIEDNERIIRWEKDIKIGDDMLIITQRGPVIIPCLSIWDINYKFIVSTTTPNPRGFILLL